MSGAGDVGVDVVGEEPERRDPAVLLSLEQHRRERCQTGRPGGERPCRHRQTVAERAVPKPVVLHRAGARRPDAEARRAAWSRAGTGMWNIDQ